MGIIQKQGIQNTIITYLGIIIGFLNLIVIQPYFLTPEEIGLTRVLFSFSSLVSVLFPLGAGHIIIRYFPHFRDPQKGHNGFFGLVLLIPVMGYCFMSLLLFLSRGFFVSQYQQESPLFSEYFDFVFPLSFALGIITVLNIYAYALFKTSVPSLLNDVAARILTILVITIYFLRWISLSQFIVLFSSVYFIQLLFLISYIFKIDKPSLRINFTRIKEHNPFEIIQYGVMLSIASIASLGLKYLDSIMIARYLPLAQVGIYTIAVFIPTVIEAPLNSLDKISTTKIASALAAGNMAEVKEIYYKSSRYMLLLGGLLFLAININISYLLEFLPAEYSDGKWVVFIVSISSFLSMACGANTAMIFNTGHYRFGVFLLIFLAASAFVLNLIFIPVYGIEGAAFATAISAVLYALMRIVFIAMKFNLQPLGLKSAALVFVTGFCLVLNHFISDFSNPLLNILVHSCLVLPLYLVSLYFLKIVPEFHKYIPFTGNKL